jgi:small GTP-binding protein
MAENFKYDVFLSYNSKDKAVVRAIAERLRADKLQVWFDEWEIKPRTTKAMRDKKLEEGLEYSRVLILCMSANAFGSDWAKLESYTFRFRDPLNTERRFISLQLDETLIKESLVQFSHINWQSKGRKKEYAKLLEACRPPSKLLVRDTEAAQKQIAEKAFQLNYDGAMIYTHAFTPDGKRSLTATAEGTVQLWDIETGRCLRVLKDHIAKGNRVAWSNDLSSVLSNSDDHTVRLWDIETGRCLRVLKGHTGHVWGLDWSSDNRLALSSASDNTVRLWEVETGRCLRVLEGHTDRVMSVMWSTDQRYALSGADDETVRLWDIGTGRCIHILQGHEGELRTVRWSNDQRYALSGGQDKTIRLWDLITGRCLRVLEGHTYWIWGLAWSQDQRFALSASLDNTVRLWEVETGRCLRILKGHNTSVRSVTWSTNQSQAFSGDSRGGIRVWDLSEFSTEVQASNVFMPTLLSTSEDVQYTNAKVLVVGDTSAGKTGLAHRIATGNWKPSDGSTVGAWSTQWQLPEVSPIKDVEREIWLWDFGGQADQRLVHQLYMDRTALILLLFDADKEDVLPGLREWQTALRRCVLAETPLLLVAGRIDAGFRASRAKLQSFAKEHGFDYFETSAKDGTNCEALSRAIMETIPWEQMEKRTSPRIFKLIKDEILRLRDEGQVLHTFKELREVLWQRLPEESGFTDETLRTVIGLLDGPGAVKELDYGTYILLQPEWITAYAQAVIRTLRQDPSELGCLPLRSIAEGKLLFQTINRDGSIVDMKRLPEAEERVVLREMERQLEERGLCLRQGDKLVFPSHCGRDRPVVMEHPSVFVSYAVQGYLDDIYATLVVKLADSESFKLKELWRDAADFETLDGDHHMGIKLIREAAGSGDISVYFAPGVTKQEQVIFANYIHAHLQSHSEQVQRLRYYVCPHCHTPKGNPQVLMQKLLAKKKAATVECDICEKRFDLWDELEKLFASETVRKEVEILKSDDLIRLDSRRKGKLLVLDVGARITSANQKWHEVPQEEDEGIDLELEFTNDQGEGTGKRLYLQLKAGNSYLSKRKTDGVEIFKIKKQRWVKYWMEQPHPVMLVIGTFAKEDERSIGKDKIEFADVRWMEISSYLKRESQNGTKPVKQIEFKGERLDLSSVRRWRDNALK